MDYPVLDVLPQLKSALTNNGIVILQAPPGAGKSTVVPLQLINESWLSGKKIVMLEPRRLAARSVAMRMSELLGENIGRTTGYRVRFESKISEDTRIEVVTEGILTRMIQTDNALEDVGLIIFDEFHERSLQADLAMALTLQVQQVLRPDLRILLMSATLDTEALSSVLNAPLVQSQGRQHPVDLVYLGDEESTPIVTRVAHAVRKALREHQGDVLVFLPGAGEIQSAHEQLEKEGTNATLHPLFGDLPFEKQQEAIRLDRSGRRKVVLATSIAETSLTIEGITVVVDSGLSRVPAFDPRSGLTRLVTTTVTRDAADQRAGRAGRLQPGTCYRLWSERRHHQLVERRQPEILEADLASLMLELATWGVKDIGELKWITPPPKGAAQQARELLHNLGALENNTITPRGKKMASLPTHPRIAHMLLEGIEKGGSFLAVATDTAAVLEERDPLPREVGVDMTLRIAALRRWRQGEKVNADRNVLQRIERLAKEWRKLFRIDVHNDAVDEYQVGEMIMSAYPERIARQAEKHGERYKLLNQRIAKIPPHDPLTHYAWLAIAQIDAGKGEGKIFQAAPLDEQSLYSHARDVRNVFWNEEHERVEGRIDQRIGNLVLTQKPLHDISTDERVSTLCRVIREKGLRMLEWNDQLACWQNRVLSLRHWRPDEAWPDVTEEALLDSIETWLAPFLSDVSRRSDFRKLEPGVILQTILPWELATKFDVLAPTRIEVPSGSRIQLTYFSDGRPPLMEVRLQEVFGLLDTPRLNEGKTPVVMQLLSPGFKPVQVTQDLKSFWANTYSDVRKELRTRYPKHFWPEDPWTAKAVRGVLRR